MWGGEKDNPKDVSHICGASNRRKKELFIKMGGKMGDRMQMSFYFSDVWKTFKWQYYVVLWQYSPKV